MTKVAYLTTARSDYGPSYWLIHDLARDPRFELQLVVAGSHLSARHGMTIAEIEHDGWPIAARIPSAPAADDERAHADAAAIAFRGMAGFLMDVRPDVLVVYADRFELLPFVSAAVLTRTPIAHVCGGDVTLGAIDDQVRHAVTKMAHVHFPSTIGAGRRIEQMGEESWRVHVAGDPALDHFKRGSHATMEELESLLGFSPDASTLLVTFHPTTLELEDVPRQARALANALRSYDGPIVMTAPAPDPGGDVVRAELERLVHERPRSIFVESLGSHRYRGLLNVVGAVVGNSSSGLIEAGCVPVPAVNIGRRQEGRERGANVIDVPADEQSIRDGIAKVLDPAFRTSLKIEQHPYGDGAAAARIVEILAHLPNRAALLRKSFVETVREVAEVPA